MAAQEEPTILNQLSKLLAAQKELIDIQNPKTYNKTSALTVSASSSTIVLAADPSVLSATITNLDGSNPMFLAIGTEATLSTHYVGPQQTAFLSQAFGDNVKIGVNGLAKTANVSAYVTAVYTVTPK